MALSAPSLWWPRLAAFVLAALAAASVVAWGLRLSASNQDSGVTAAVTPSLAPDPQAVGRALGANAATPSSKDAYAPPALESARFALLGVVANGQGRGAALLSVDGKPPKPYAAGAAVVDGWVLQSVQGRRATLARTGQEVALELPALASAGSAPAATSKKWP